MAAMASCKRFRLLLQRMAARTLSPICFSSRYSSSLQLPCSTASSSLPLLLLPSEEVAAGGHKQEVNFKSFLSLGNNKVSSFEKELPNEIADAHCAGSSNGWVAFVNRRDCRVYLADLFASSNSPKIVPLPSILSLPRLMGVLHDSSSSSSIKHFMEFDIDGPIPKSPDHMSRDIVRRLAMSSPPILENGSLNRNCVVMISTFVGHDVAFCRIGDNCWTSLGRIRGWDIVYSKRDKLFYCLTSQDGDVKAWDFNISPRSSPFFPKRVDVDVSYGEIEESSFSEEVRRAVNHISNYLVESPEGDILVLVRHSVSIGEDGSFVDCDDYPNDVHHPYRTVRFDVFKLDPEKKTAEVVKNLGDTVLFVGLNESFSFSARDHPELSPNSIYFADDHSTSIFSDTFPYGGDDMGIYNLEDHSITPLYHPFQFKKILPPPIWVSCRP